MAEHATTTPAVDGEPLLDYLRCAMAEITSWELHAIRNKAGVFTCEMTDPRGTLVVEPLDVAVRAVDRRKWSNPPDEIARIKKLSDCLIGDPHQASA